ncbi:hypothetical protein P154DRAFT_395080, partial [Amniculicola lignicola CBS 123094]
DACAKAVSCGPSKPPPRVPKSTAAKSDCSSFLKKTVSPCPITSTRIKISTKSAKPTTKTSTKTTTVISSKTATAYKTIDQTIVSTQERTQLTTLEIPETSIALTTETTTTTSTVLETTVITTTFSTVIVTSTLGASPTPIEPKRAVVSIIPSRSYAASGLDERGYPVDQCRPSTRSAHNIPKYASSCRGAGPYSSACHRLGVWGQTTTLRPYTTYATKTTVTTVTPTIWRCSTRTFSQIRSYIITKPHTQLHTAISTIVQTQTVTKNATAVVTSTTTHIISETLTRTQTSVESVIATSVTVATPTPTPTPTGCGTTPFRLRVDGDRPAPWVREYGNAFKMGFTDNVSEADIFSVDDQNRLFHPSSGLFPNTDAATLYYVYLDSEEFVVRSGFLFLTC